MWALSSKTTHSLLSEVNASPTEPDSEDRCQRSSVFGVTRKRSQRVGGSRRAAAARNTRSESRKRGRLTCSPKDIQLMSEHDYLEILGRPGPGPPERAA